MPKNILVIDDTFETRNLTKLKLKEAGYSVATCVDGVDALKSLKNSPVPIDLILTDFRMPNLGGQDWLELLNHHYPNIKKIVISGYPFIQAHLPPEIPLLLKPVKWEETLPMIAKMLGQ